VVTGEGERLERLGRELGGDWDCGEGGEEDANKSSSLENEGDVTGEAALVSVGCEDVGCSCCREVGGEWKTEADVLCLSFLCVLRAPSVP